MSSLIQSADNKIGKEKNQQLTNKIIDDSQSVVHHCKWNKIASAKNILSSRFINLETQDENGFTAFHYACIHEDITLFNLLLDNYICSYCLDGYISDETEHFIKLCENNEQKTILHYIGEKDLIQFYKQLVYYFPHGVEEAINFTTSSGKTALHLASEKGNHQILAKLIKLKNVNVNHIDENGATVLHLACENHSIRQVKLLLEHPQINVNLQDNNGNTPLHIIAQDTQYAAGKILKELLFMHSLRADIKNNEQLLPHQIAENCQNYEIAALIQEKIRYGAPV